MYALGYCHRPCMHAKLRSAHWMMLPVTWKLRYSGMGTSSQWSTFCRGHTLSLVTCKMQDPKHSALAWYTNIRFAVTLLHENPLITYITLLKKRHPCLPLYIIASLLNGSSKNVLWGNKARRAFQEARQELFWQNIHDTVSPTANDVSSWEARPWKRTQAVHVQSMCLYKYKHLTDSEGTRSSIKKVRYAPRYHASSWRKEISSY